MSGRPCTEHSLCRSFCRLCSPARLQPVQNFHAEGRQRADGLHDDLRSRLRYRWCHLCQRVHTVCPQPVSTRPSAMGFAVVVVGSVSAEQCARALSETLCWMGPLRLPPFSCLPWLVFDMDVRSQSPTKGDASTGETVTPKDPCLIHKGMFLLVLCRQC